ncbi:MAG: dUTPase [Persephonella sp.]|nr:MAG: dUTPase [Persephonella sp.]
MDNIKLDQSKLIEMFKLQDELNKKINKNWKGIRKKSDFVRAIWIECAELVDSLPWKWWKKQEMDINNVKIELVDMWHFIISYILLNKFDYKDAVNSDYIKYFEKGMIRNFENLKVDPIDLHHFLGETNKTERLIFAIERVVENFLSKRPLEAIFFYGLTVSEVMDFGEMYLLYIGKNILNHIRQEFGYKEGNYKKHIDGIEDNKYMLEIVKNVKSKEELEKAIRKKFEEILKD